MPTPEQVQAFRTLMGVLTTKTETELKEMMFDPKTPPIVAEIIMMHPALLGGKYKELGPARKDDPFVSATNEIIKAHGFGHCSEWEYECDQKTHRPNVLRIWLGKKRTKKTLRELTLTEEEATRVQTLLA